MTRVIQFKQTEDSYVCFENDNIIFKISKTDLQFNVKDFYYAFYGENKDYEEIILENTIPTDRKATRIYECIINLINKIKDKLSEIPVDEEVSNE